ncbi:potassium transporter 19-like protein, partial [Tanacetum coccineum]
MYAKQGLLPSEQVEDRDVSNFRLELPNKSNKIASSIKQTLESSNFSKFSLLFAAMLGTSMVIGDGILTPSMSVLSAVSGLKKATDSMTEGLELTKLATHLPPSFVFGSPSLCFHIATVRCLLNFLDVRIPSSSLDSLVTYEERTRPTLEEEETIEGVIQLTPHWMREALKAAFNG